MEADDQGASRAAKGRFATTQWSLVVSAGDSQSPQARDAMESLARVYWYPLYAYLRRAGTSAHDAEDLTQGFFANRIVTRELFKGVSPDRGRFRTWLLNCLRNFQRNEWQAKNAKKRGGGVQHVSLDGADWEDRLLASGGEELSPPEEYDRAWAITMIKRAHEQLRAKYCAAKAESFDQLSVHLPGVGTPPPIAETARTLAKSIAATKMAVSRLRREFGLALRDEISRTVSTPEELDEELRYLISAIGR